jgi:hypothetical protein
MKSAVDLVRQHILMVVIALAVGVAAGIPLGWATVRVVNTTPAVMRPDLQEDYLRMAIDSFRVNRDPNLAVQRWDELGPAAATMFVKVQEDPKGMDPAVIVAYGQVIQAVKGQSLVPEGSQGTPSSSGTAPFRTALLIAAVVVLALVAAAVVLFVMRRASPRLARARATASATSSASSSSSMPAPAPAARPTRAAPRTDFESLGVAPPITQNMTTYVLGDDLYDESFSIDTASGDFLGEYGVGVSETIGVGEPKKVTALEIWLFDKNDIKTATKVLMSAHAFRDPGIRGRLEAKGELIEVEPQRQIMLETETVQLLATVVDLQYGDGAMPEKSYFERVTLELAIWRKADHS